MVEKTMSDTAVGNNAEDREPVEDRRVAHLIEQLKQRKVELEDANRELQHISRYRSLFLARMSHELRTPLTSILGFSEILLDQEQLTDTQRRFCQKIQNSGLQLLTSLNQLVDFSRLEVAPAELFLHEFSLRDTIRETCAAVDRVAQKHEVKVEYDLDPEITTVVSDQGRLRQVLYTFLAWAVSRSSEGQAVSLYAQFNNSGGLLVRIDDQGAAVTEVARVFEPDESAYVGKTDLNEMGVIIGKRLLQVMKGTVTLENRPTGGLRTLIQIPAGQPRS